MKKLLIFLTLLHALVLGQTNSSFEYGEGIFAKITTNIGIINVQLEYEKAPLTVANFIGLVEGWIPNNHTSFGECFYDGLIFHEKNSKYITGGSPTNDKYGTAGYSIIDEFHNELNHDNAGVLSMYKNDISKNSSQFIITTKMAPYLDYSVFGHVFDDIDLNTVRGLQSGDYIESINIIRRGNLANRFDALKIYNYQMKLGNVIKSHYQIGDIIHGGYIFHLEEGRGLVASIRDVNDGKLGY